MIQRWYLKAVQHFLPSPMSIALLLLIVALLLASLFGDFNGAAGGRKFEVLLGYFEDGFWDLLEFSMQMVLILLLGHVLALSAPVTKLIYSLSRMAESTGSAVVLVSISTMAMGLLNWGLGLIFGALLARNIASNASTLSGKRLNYPLIAAAGYLGMMVWHGGLSASAPLKAAEANHFLVAQIGVIPIEETLGSSLNIAVIIALFIIIPLGMWMLSRQFASENITIDEAFIWRNDAERLNIIPNTFAEKVDHTHWIARIIGGLIVVTAMFTIFQQQENQMSLAFISLNFVNFLLFGLALLLHGSIHNFMQAVDKAVQGTAGIIIQFPIYAGIMGIMSYSGLAERMSLFFVEIATTNTLPAYTFFSAALVNFFIPSGGGQWAIQGPVICEAAASLQVPIPKIIMAMAYGDQISNMIQPFWALPLLGITGLSAGQILRYSALIMLLGAAIFILCLYLF